MNRLLAAIGVVGAAGLIYWLWKRQGHSLGDAALDREMARQSLREECEAIRAYTERLKNAENPKLKEALRHARKEERQHAAMFSPLTGPTPSMLKMIAAESKSPEEYARRAEAWASTEANPPSITKMAKAYRGAPPSTTTRLIREAREAREEGRERLWTRMSRGLR